MNIIKKIFSLFLLMFLLLSFSGAKMRIHFCSHSQALYADLLWFQDDNSSGSCEKSNPEKTCCGNSVHDHCRDENECNHCSDFVLKAEMETENGLLSFSEFVDIAEKELFHTMQLFDAEYCKYKYQTNYIVFHPPPEAKTTSIWLC